MSLNATLRLNYAKNLNNKIVSSNTLVKKDEKKTSTGISSKSQRIENKTKSKIGKIPRKETNNENDKNVMNICVNMTKDLFGKKDSKEIKKTKIEVNTSTHKMSNILNDKDDNMSGNKQKLNSTQKLTPNIIISNNNDLDVSMKSSSKDDSAVKEQESGKQFREKVLGDLIKINGGDKIKNDQEKAQNINKITNINNFITIDENTNNNFLNKTIKQVQIDLINPLQTNFSLNYENLLINKQNVPKFTNDEYRKMFSKLIRKEYSKSILNNLFDDEELIDDPLLTHKVTERMRVRMVDWMIEVFTNYKCDDHSFFIAIDILDRFFKANENVKCLQPGDLHLIGVTAMFMASKYQDIYPLRLRTVHEKIAHKKLGFEEIKSKEEEISKTLNYILGKPTQWDFINHFIEEIFFTSYNYYHITDKKFLEHYLNVGPSNDKEKVTLFTKFYCPNMINLLKHVAIYLAKMNTHDYGLISKKPSLIAASTIYVAMKICEQINKEEYVHELFTKKLVDVSKKNENDIIKCAQKILNNAQNFDNIFTGLENLKKVHFNAIIELKNTK